MQKLTVIIPCKDERLNIRPCIESARRVADEILIADSGSTDGTLDIVQEMGGCRVIEREYVHSGDFKNWAIPQATHSWVLILDADERITEELAAEIKKHLASGPEHDGYWVPRQNYFLGHPIRYSGWQNDVLMRFFHRDRGRYVGDTDHAEVAINTGRVGRLKSKLTHYTYWSYDQYFRKFERYTKWQANVWHQQGRKPSTLRLLTTGPLRFLRGYVIQRGFLDGLPGLQLCMLHGFYSFMKQARLWELHYGISQPVPDLLPKSGLADKGKGASPQSVTTRPRRAA
ncbi:MAG: glycosyltransferase family 2 protein [Planctomycetales bacterium]|nr:glycosyltransferase family 2 protein [Planctomycetales bacterium]